MKKSNRRAFLAKAMALSSAVSLPFSGIGKEEEIEKEETLPSLNGRKILFTYGGWDGHEPSKFVDYLTPWMKEEGAEVHLSKTLDPYANKAVMDNIDLVIQIFTMSQITSEQERGLLEAVEKNGTGMAGWHGGMCIRFAITRTTNS